MPVITVDNVSKRYRKGQTSYHTLREDIYELTGRIISLGGNSRRDRDAEHIWALRDVSFQIEPGERVGIIGRNGSGKTTLLRLLAGITRPTQGKISVKGRLGVIIELMAGFHPEMTGRENIFLNGAIIGMSRKEIKRKYDEIVAFAELEDFIDTPIKRYSSGMQVRLGFAVAAHLEPDILLVDEVLAVGDTAFQKKCLGKMEDVAKGGRTVLFVSHNMAAITALCDHGILLENGQVKYSGSAKESVELYLRAMSTQLHQPVGERKDRIGEGWLRITSISSRGAKDQDQPVIVGQDAIIDIAYASTLNDAIRNVKVGISIQDSIGQSITHMESDYPREALTTIPPHGVIRCYVPRLPLTLGRYILTVCILVKDEPIDWIPDAAEMNVMEGDFFGTGGMPPKEFGPLVLDQAWSLVNTRVGETYE